MEIKVLGTGCSSCKALYETTKQAISELGCDATLIKEEDLLKIMEYNILGLPALVIDGKVVSAGKRLSLSEVKELITKSKMNYEKVILSTDCDAGLNVLWKWFKEKKRGKQSGRNTA